MYPNNDPQYDIWFAQAANDDSQEAFGKLFKALYGTLCSFALKYAPCNEDAEEVVSEVFLKVWNKRKELELTTSIRYYLVVCVRNQCVDLIRKESKWRKTDLSQAAVASHEPDITRRMADREALTYIEGIIDALPRQCQHVFRLSRYEGLKYEDIARTMGISVKTVETQISRALKRLRTAYAVL